MNECEQAKPHETKPLMSIYVILFLGEAAQSVDNSEEYQLCEYQGNSRGKNMVSGILPAASYNLLCLRCSATLLKHRFHPISR